MSIRVIPAPHRWTLAGLPWALESLAAHGIQLTFTGLPDQWHARATATNGHLCNGTGMSPLEAVNALEKELFVYGRKEDAPKWEVGPVDFGNPPSLAEPVKR